jgi:eukaryotic-like serine/threonine-protein kinase
MPVAIRCTACQAMVTLEGKAAAAPTVCPMCGKPLPPARPTDALVGKTIAGHRLVKRIGAGANAVVYESERIAGGGRFAIKMLTHEASQDEENGKRFVREAKLCRQITHPNVVQVHEVGCEKKIHFMVMELIEGSTMEAVIDKQGPMPWRETAHLVMQVGQALDHMNKLGIIHRDIKPGNILLTKGGIAKLLDLGFAKKLGDHDTDVPGGGGNLTMQGVSMGSPAYMPPEQVLDAKQALQTADVYSLGATFYHAVTGQTPFNGKTAYEIMEKVIRQPPQSPQLVRPDIPVAISQFIEWTMDKLPERRPQSAGEFVRELEVAVFAPEDGVRIPRLRGAKNRTWVLPVVLSVGGVLLLAGLALLVRYLHH